MTIDRMVMRFAGALVLVGLALGSFVNEYWYWLSAFVGFNLFQASFTGFCRTGSVPSSASTCSRHRLQGFVRSRAFSSVWASSLARHFDLP